VVRLPNGDGFQYAMANYHSASGKSLEMNGVSPDETVVLSRELLLADPDPVLSRAVQWIQQQNVQKTP
jgi:carboxyl-terminal processing protease